MNDTRPMKDDSFKDIEKLESDLWQAADNLRANSKLTSNQYFMTVLGIIFLRHAANRFAAASRQIEEDHAAGRMPQAQGFWHLRACGAGKLMRLFCKPI